MLLKHWMLCFVSPKSPSRGRDKRVAGCHNKGALICHSVNSINRPPVCIWLLGTLPGFNNNFCSNQQSSLQRTAAWRWGSSAIPNQSDCSLRLHANAWSGAIQMRLGQLSMMHSDKKKNMKDITLEFFGAWVWWKALDRWREYTQQEVNGVIVWHQWEVCQKHLVKHVGSVKLMSILHFVDVLQSR